jgi:hypothetical protein
MFRSGRPRYHIAMRRPSRLLALVPAALLWTLASLAAPSPIRAALANPPKEDIHFLAEHAPEAAQDARVFALPWPAERMAPGRWQAFVGAGWNEAKADFIKEHGVLASFGGAYGWSERSGLSLFGFYDSFSVDGGTGERVLRPFFVTGVPLDLPETAQFSHPRGSVRHFGVGASWVHELSPANAPHTWTLQAGALVDRLEVDGYRLDFQILSGASTGARGVLDHSSQATYVTPFLGIEGSWPLGSSFVFRPRVAGGAPLPPGDFDGRITTGGVDRSSRDAGGKPGQIGDGFLSLGAGLLHKPSGLEVDLGSTLGYALFESATHAGIDRAYLLYVTWHLPAGRER